MVIALFSRAIDSNIQLRNTYTATTQFHFVTYLTVEPNKEEIMPFLKNFTPTF